MKLSTDDIKQLMGILNTCIMGGVDSLIIENGVIRAANESKTFAIISDSEVPKFSQKIGISRLGALKSRIDIFGGNGLTIEANESGRGEISSLDISAGKSRVQFRCTSTALIKAPVSVNDTELYSIFLDKSEIKFIIDAVKVMNGKLITISVDELNKVQFEVRDASNEAFKIELVNKAEKLGDSTQSVTNYAVDVFLPILRYLSDNFDRAVLVIGERGTLSTKVGTHRVVLLPQISED
jgi:hypothetical protein